VGITRTGVLVRLKMAAQLGGGPRRPAPWRGGGGPRGASPSNQAVEGQSPSSPRSPIARSPEVLNWCRARDSNPDGVASTGFKPVRGRGPQDPARRSGRPRKLTSVPVLPSTCRAVAVRLAV
jgi:hypothetical protein